MFSAIPKIADKTFVIAYLLPVLLFAGAILAFFRESDSAQEIFDKITGDERDLEKIAYLAIALWGASLALMILNQIIFRVVEGYYLPASFANWRRETQISRYDRMQSRMDQIKALFNETPDVFTREHELEYDLLYMRLVKQFPAKERILPTSFGNAIRAFEDYSRTVYGADALPLWIHLSTVMPKDYGAIVEDARAHVSFYMNTFVIAVVFAFIVVGQFALDAMNPRIAHVALVGEALSSFGWMFAALCVASAAYLLSLERIYSWGCLVKAGFDCYLPALAQKLGHSLPITSADQKRFWVDVSRRAIYHQPLIAEAWPRARVENACEPPGKSEANDEQEEG